MIYEHARHEYFKRLSNKLEITVPVILHKMILEEKLPCQMIQESCLRVIQDLPSCQKLIFKRYEFFDYISELGLPRSSGEPLLYEWQSDSQKEKLWRLMAPKQMIIDLFKTYKPKKSFFKRLFKL